MNPVKEREIMTESSCTNEIIVALIPLIAAITFAINALVAYFQTRVITSRLKALSLRNNS